MSIITFLRKLFDDKKYAQLTVMVVTGVIATAIALVIIILGIKTIASFVINNIEIVMLILGALLFIIIWITDRNKKNVELRQQEEEKIRYMAEVSERTFLENKYNLTRNMIYLTIKDTSEILKIEKPKRVEDLDLPERNQKKKNYFINQFIVLKNGEIDPIEVKEILQIKITQKLNSFDFPGINQNIYIYEGHIYPILMIDEVHDFGRYLYLDVVWVSERYCKLVNNRLIARQLELERKSNIVVDKDF